jgi:hypothetical protein
MHLLGRPDAFLAAKGMEAMRYSLASRDLIADCIEMMHEVRKDAEPSLVHPLFHTKLGWH